MMVSTEGTYVSQIKPFANLVLLLRYGVWNEHVQEKLTNREDCKNTALWKPLCL